MELKSLKGLNPDDTEVSSLDKEPEYPYGARISLHDAELDAVAADDCKVDDEVIITAKAYVSSKSAYEYKGDKDRRSIEFQITDIAIDKGQGKDDGTIARELYDD